MALDIEEVSDAGMMAQGISGAVVHTILTLVRETCGDIGVTQVLAMATERRPYSELTGGWTPLHDAVGLLQAASILTRDEDFSLHVGEELMWTGDGGDLGGRLRSLGSAEEALHHVGAVVDRFQTGADTVTLEVGPGRALVEVATDLGTTRHALLCELTGGLLAEIPALFAPTGATVVEQECSARGGQTCRYELTWRTADHGNERHGPGVTAWHPPTDPGARWAAGSYVDDVPSRSTTGAAWLDDESQEDWVEEPEGPSAGAILAFEAQLAAARSALEHAVSAAARWEAEAIAGRRVVIERDRSDAARTALEAEVDRLQLEVDRLERLLAGPATTGADLLVQDIDGVLDSLAARAAEALDGRGLVLVVRPIDGSPARLRSHGLDPAEVRDVEAALWTGSGRPGLHVAHIGTPPDVHGHIGILTDLDGIPPADVTRSLERVASLASTTLELFSALSEARHSDSTARALLSFSDRLSGITTLTAALQVLADVVPDVTGCSQSTVYLWDATRFRLAAAAHTEGVEAPEDEIQVLVPSWSKTHPARHGWHQPAPGEDRHADLPVTVRMDSPDVDRMVKDRSVLVLDRTTTDPLLRSMLDSSGLAASVVAPLFAAGEFLGVLAANFDHTIGSAVIRDPRLHERLGALADHAATAIQNLQLLEQVSHMAWHDALTGLPNRRLFEDRVDQELVRSKRLGDPVCIFFVDLDRFKDVNDSFGHATGDALINQVGQRLQACVRDQDTVARLGGDEFAILLPGLADQFSINQLAERALDAVHTPFDIFGEVVTISASLGIAIAPEHGDTYDDLLNRADKAMFRVKDHGRDGFEIYEDPNGPVHPGRRLHDERELYGDLVKAIARNEFFLLYQPTIDLRTADVVGVEALIRWAHPTLGVLDPVHFVPLAERSDLIVSLDSWVLWQSCRQLRSWLDHGLEPMRLSVNVASRDLASPEFFDTVHRTLRDTDIDPALLELEITDRVVLTSGGTSTENIDRLHRLGVRFSIDDFGSGYSALDRIASFPVSTVKIDGSFVSGIGPEDDENALVSAIIAMANRLGVSCVAEGVESAMQSKVLLKRGCTLAQGNYFSEPLTAEAFESMIRSATPAEVPDFFAEPPRPAEGNDSASS